MLLFIFKGTSLIKNKEVTFDIVGILVCFNSFIIECGDKKSKKKDYRTANLSSHYFFNKFSLNF